MTRRGRRETSERKGSSSEIEYKKILNEKKMGEDVNEEERKRKERRLQIESICVFLIGFLAAIHT